MSLERIRDILTRSRFASEAYRNAMDRLNDEWHCLHERTEIRVKTDALGRPMYAYQCLRCGSKPESWVPKSAIPPGVGAISPMDDTLSRRFMAEKDAAQKELAASFGVGGREWWVAYNEYTASWEWRQRRDKVLRRANYICEGCGEQAATQVHHLTYEHVGDELLWELRAVCDGCHAKVHPHIRETA